MLDLNKKSSIRSSRISAKLSNLSEEDKYSGSLTSSNIPDNKEEDQDALFPQEPKEEKIIIIEIYIWLTHKDMSDLTYTIKLELSEQTLVKTVIQKTIDKFNEDHHETFINNKKYSISFEDFNNNNYKLKFAKKNKKPKTDYSALNGDVMIGNSGSERFCLIFDENLSKYNEVIDKESSKNCSCLVF